MANQSLKSVEAAEVIVPPPQGNRITLPPWRRLELEGEKHLPNLREAACS